MKDHTYNGIPISQMPEEALYRCLNKGFTFNTRESMTESEATYWIKLRLEVEVIRRRLGIAVRGMA